jgi:hypothetical protein
VRVLEAAGIMLPGDLDLDDQVVVLGKATGPGRFGSAARPRCTLVERLVGCDPEGAAFVGGAITRNSSWVPVAFSDANQLVGRR